MHEVCAGNTSGGWGACAFHSDNVFVTFFILLGGLLLAFACRVSAVYLHLLSEINQNYPSTDRSLLNFAICGGFTTRYGISDTLNWNGTSFTPYLNVNSCDW